MSMIQLSCASSSYHLAPESQMLLAPGSRVKEENVMDNLKGRIDEISRRASRIKFMDNPLKRGANNFPK